MSLNAEQARIVTALTGRDAWRNAIVSADAGSGKTYTQMALVAALAIEPLYGCIVFAPTAVAAQAAAAGHVFGAPMDACTAAALITPAAQSTLWPRIRTHALQRQLALLHLVADEFAMLTDEQFSEVVFHASAAVAGTRCKLRLVLFGDEKQLPPVSRSLFAGKTFQDIMQSDAACFTLRTLMRFDVADAEMCMLASALVARDANAVGHLTRLLWVAPHRPAPVAGTTPALFLSYTNQVARLHNMHGLVHLACAQRIVYFLVDPSSHKVVDRLVQGGRVSGTKNRRIPGTFRYTIANGQQGTLDSITGTPFACTESTKRYCRNWRTRGVLLDRHLEAVVDLDAGDTVTLPALSVGGKLYSLHLQLSYGLTFHAVQGLTLTCKCVIDLNGVPNWNMLYVALSRTSRFALMYLIPWDDSSGLNELVTAPVAPAVAAFQASFTTAARPVQAM